MTNSQLVQELSKANVDQHLLVTPQMYGSQSGIAPNEAQPFEIVVHPQVSFLCDLHTHLSTAEVIGLLAGKWDVVRLSHIPNVYIISFRGISNINRLCCFPYLNHRKAIVCISKHHFHVPRLTVVTMVQPTSS